MDERNLSRCSTLNIAHRGARSLAPENTLAAARAALEIGADMWELDVQLTADGEFIVFHDEGLERTSNARAVFPNRRPWLVWQFTLDEIRQLDFGSWFNETDPFGEIAAGHVTRAQQRSYVGEPAPTLRQALEWTRDHDWRVNVELKDLDGRPGEERFVEDVVHLIQDMRMTDRVMISSFNHEYVRRAKIADPAIRAGVLTSRAIDHVAEYVRSLGADAYNPAYAAIDPAQIRPLRDQGIEVYIYTVNDEQEMRDLVEAGASGLFTDFPQRLHEVLQTCRAAK